MKTALVLETNNLAGGDADGAQVALTLCRLLARLREQTRPLATLAEVVITHDGLAASEQRRVTAAAGRELRFVELPPGTNYYEAKNLGFDATSAEVVAFGDSDCWPDPAWLEELLAPILGDDAVAVVAGRTTYRRDLLGAAASTIDFMYFPSPLGEGAVRNFYANNVAFRREIFAARRYRPDAMYRGHCQVLGMKLHEDGVRVRFAPAARTIHRFPDDLGEMLRLRLHRGADTVSLAPHLVRTYLPARLRFAARSRRLAPLSVLATRFAFSVRSIGRQDMPPTRGLAYAGCVGAIAGITMVDAVGAMLASRRRDAAHAVLSYHGDRDRLA